MTTSIDYTYMFTQLNIDRYNVVTITKGWKIKDYNYITIIYIKMVLTSSGTFSHSPLTAATSSFLDGFCLSFLLNEILRNDHFFFTFSFFGFLLLSPFSIGDVSDALLSFSVSSLPFSTDFGVSVVDVADGDTAGVVVSSPPSGFVFIISFSVVISFSFSAPSESAFFSLS